MKITHYAKSEIVTLRIMLLCYYIVSHDRTLACPISTSIFYFSNNEGDSVPPNSRACADPESFFRGGGATFF